MDSIPPIPAQSSLGIRLESGEEPVSVEGETSQVQPSRIISPDEVVSVEQTPIPSGSNQSPEPTPNPTPRLTRKRGRPSTSTPATTGTTTGKRPRPSQANTQVIVPERLDFLQIPLPHYELITRRGTLDQPHLFRIKTGVSDGSEAKWPELGVPNHNSDAYHNASEDYVKTWLLKIGNAMAAIQDWPGAGTETYMLDAFPEQYRLFSCINVLDNRSDRYLCGSTTTKKFRSGNEFCAHLVWLLRNGPGVDEFPCPCKNCTGAKFQKDINLKMGITQTSGTYLSKQPTEVQKPNRQLLKPRKGKGTSPPPTYLGSYTNKYRDDDLALNAAPYRQTEMVWAKLPHPLVHSEKSSSFEITYWPGVIQAREVKTESSLLGALTGPGQPAEFDTVQRRVYSVQLLALEEMIVVEEYDVLPWLGLSPKTPEPSEFQRAECSSLVYDGKLILMPKLSQFNGDSKLAMTAYALAIHTAAHVVLKFALTDPYRLERGHIVTQSDELSEANKSYLEQEQQATHFQSIWWGPEQIHSEELVRVVVRPDQIDQATTLPLSSDINTRGFLFKLSSIFRAAITEGKEPVIKAAGVLVELVKVDNKDGPLKEEEEVDDTPAVSLPKPPSGYRFRQVTRKDSEVHIDVEYIAGRYYSLPDEFDSHPIRVEAALHTFLEDKESADKNESAGAAVDFLLTADQLALVLAGVLPGWHKCIHASTWAPDRFAMISKAETTGNDELKQWFDALASANQ